MTGPAEITLWSFLLAYLFLFAVLLIMKRCRIDQTKLLVVGSIRMTVQMVIAGYVLSYIIAGHQWLTPFFLLVMFVFAVSRVLSKNRWMNRRFRIISGGSLVISGLAVLLFYLSAVIRQDLYEAQYTIPLAGMVVGNAMTGLNLGLKTFRELLETGRAQIDALLDVGASPKDILLPYVNKALGTAMFPTINSMVGMGIVFLPGMMSGQIVSGVDPVEAILYQMSITMGLCAAVCLSSSAALYFGYHTLCNDRDQIQI